MVFATPLAAKNALLKNWSNIFLSDLCIRVLMAQKCLKFWQNELNSILEFVLSHNYWQFSSFKVSIWSFPLVLDFFNKNQWFCPMQWKLEGWKMQKKVLSVLTCLYIQAHLSSALPASFFHQCVIRSFSTIRSRRIIRSWKSWKLFCTSDFGLWLVKNGNGAISINLSGFCNSFFGNSTF